MAKLNIPPKEVRKGRQFCWYCSRQLHAKVSGVVLTRPDGSTVLVHATICADKAKKDIEEGF